MFGKNMNLVLRSELMKTTRMKVLFAKIIVDVTPDNCNVCPLLGANPTDGQRTYYCLVTGDGVSDTLDYRPQSCPLFSVQDVT